MLQRSSANPYLPGCVQEVASDFAAAFAAARAACDPSMCRVTPDSLASALVDTLANATAAAVLRQCPGATQIPQR